MFVAGYFYGAISAAQVTVDALARFLCERCTVPGKRKDVKRIWRELAKAGEVSAEVREAALCIYRDRDDYHHLRGTVEQDYNSLEARATDCINKLYAIELEVFAG